ncbi:MAG: Ferric siderophore transport system, periplasmic binding protein TonB, partial [Labilithrix sp.]|nr:Ferric siderophore transport system, periplasmic binding protein TonB [Labilithrix sp.]
PAAVPAADTHQAPAGGSDIPDLGLSLSGSTGGGGLAVPAGPAAPAAPAASTQVTRKVLAAAPRPATDACTELPVKPKVRTLTQPSYTAEAREAGVAGKVRVELTVDAGGNVASARVLEGLGHGLDEAALSAARAATFEPGTRCGVPASATFVIAMRFAL